MTLPVHRDRIAGSTLLLIVAALVLLPVGALLYGSFRDAHPLAPSGAWTLDNYGRALASPVLWATISNSLVYSLGAVALATVAGASLAWVVVRTDTPWRPAFEFLTYVLFLIPNLLYAVAWIMLLAPGRGVLNNIYSDTLAPGGVLLDIYSLQGMVWVQGLCLVPLVFLLVSGPLSAMDQSLEEASRISGSGTLSTLRRVTIPIMRPAVFSAALLAWIVSIETFEVPQLLGSRERLFTFPSLIYHQVRNITPADYGLASAFGSLLLVASLAGVLLYRRATTNASRFVTVRGKGYRPAQRIQLGRWRWATFAACCVFFAVTLLLPIAILVLGSLLRFFGQFDVTIFQRMSLDNYGVVFTHPTLLAGFRNSFLLASISAAFCVALGAGISYMLLRGRMRGKWALEGLSMLPLAYPATVLALGLLWSYITLPVPIYGTLLILGIAYITRYIPMGLRSVSGGLLQVDRELGEASAMSGASELYSVRRVLLPLIRPSLVAGWLLIFMILVRELSMSVLLTSAGNPVLSVVLFDYYQNGQLGEVSAVAVVMLAVIIVIVAVARRLLRGRAVWA